MRFRLTLTTLLFLLAAAGKANAENGYIVTAAGDTVKSLIVVKKTKAPWAKADLDLCHNHEVWVQKGLKLVSYRPEELKAYCFSDGIDTFFYCSMIVPDGTRNFLELVQPGRLEVFKQCIEPDVCGNQHKYLKSAYLLRLSGKDNLVYIQRPCDSIADFDAITLLIGKEHPVSIALQKMVAKQKHIDARDVLWAVSVYNANVPDLEKTMQEMKMFCDTCIGNALFLKKKNINIVQRSWMGTYAESGFYLYEGGVYGFQFAGGEKFDGILWRIDSDKMTVTKGFANFDNTTTADTITYPLSALERIGYRMDGLLPVKYKLNDFEFHVERLVGYPAKKFLIYRKNGFRNVRRYFHGEDAAFVFLQNGYLTWVE